MITNDRQNFIKASSQNVQKINLSPFSFIRFFIHTRIFNSWRPSSGSFLCKNHEREWNPHNKKLNSRHSCYRVTKFPFAPLLCISFIAKFTSFTEKVENVARKRRLAKHFKGTVSRDGYISECLNILSVLSMYD
jgi:hypothetical protein